MSLLEDFAISPLVGLTTDNNWLIPGPHVIDKFPVLGFLGTELGELVAFIVGCNVESWKSFLASDEEGTADNTVIGLTVDTGSTEDVLSACLKTVEETTYQIPVSKKSYYNPL